VAIGILAFHKQVAVILTELIAEYNFVNLEGKRDLGDFEGCRWLGTTD
jgi:hypothetical protein